MNKRSEDYLDTGRSVMISAPAGSGKTEKLARRYIELLRAGAEVERILAITFTEKAAAEMKQRILRILQEEDAAMFESVLQKMPLMRVTTIHAFCASLLRRFAHEAGLDPNFRIHDAISSWLSREEVLYEVLMEADSDDDSLISILSSKGFRGLAHLKTAVDFLFGKSPFSLIASPYQHSADISSLQAELRGWPGASGAVGGYNDLIEHPSPETISLIKKAFLTDAGSARKRAPSGPGAIEAFSEWTEKMRLLLVELHRQDAADVSVRMLKIFARCMSRYMKLKLHKGLVDFSDLEYLTYMMLTTHEEWANILYAFDEKTDHILVDEFQDTNSFQWAIINKLTEEWQAGQGAKREEGRSPTIFLVGDDKQSIYYFRGANVENFHRARQRLEEWLGEEFIFLRSRENYRSLPVIIEFTNRLFSGVMDPGEDAGHWRTRYSRFEPARKDPDRAGVVEIIISDEGKTSVAESKQREAEALAIKIKGLAGRYHIIERGTGKSRPCEFRDMAVLLRKRTHLRHYEEALRRNGIPFAAVRGIGFYQEPEVATLRALVFFLSNPHDDYSLYILLKSPLFGLDEASILRIASAKGDSLYDRLRRYSEDRRGATGKIRETFDGLLNDADRAPLPVIIEKALPPDAFSEPQRAANVRKFIRIIEQASAEGASVQKVRDMLERTYERQEEPKANVNSEGMNAVSIMTIHAAKGLQFPIVFLPGLEEPFKNRSDEHLVYEHDGEFIFKTVPEKIARHEDPDFMHHKERETEEQKRLLYVAVTRAECALYMFGKEGCSDKCMFGFIRSGLGLDKEPDMQIEGVSVRTDEEIIREDAVAEPAKKPGSAPAASARPRLTVPELKGRSRWKAVTSETTVRTGHGMEWEVIGTVMHELFEHISRGVIDSGGALSHAEHLLTGRTSGDDQNNSRMSLITAQMNSLAGSEIMNNIISPQPDSWAELPFVLNTGDEVYSGRIDRIVKKGGCYHVYDYKTFPLKEDEIPYIMKEYAPQMELYKRAVAELFESGDVRTYIIFTHNGIIREC